jgi:hypothetical protein
MNGPAIARPPERSRLVMIVAGVLALLGSFVVTAPAQAGYYGDSYYRPNPCSYRCGYAPYRYYAPRYYNGCGRCGCYRRCGGSGAVYERRYIEREYVERRYGGYGGYRRCYGDYPCGGYRRHYGYYPYGGYEGYRRPYGYGYGGIGRRWPTPSLYYEPAADGYEEPPRPPAPVYGYGESEY